MLIRDSLHHISLMISFLNEEQTVNVKIYFVIVSCEGSKPFFKFNQYSFPFDSTKHFPMRFFPRNLFIKNLSVLLPARPIAIKWNLLHNVIIKKLFQNDLSGRKNLLSSSGNLEREYHEGFFCSILSLI